MCIAVKASSSGPEFGTGVGLQELWLKYRKLARYAFNHSAGTLHMPKCMLSEFGYAQIDINISPKILSVLHSYIILQNYYLEYFQIINRQSPQSI